MGSKMTLRLPSKRLLKCKEECSPKHADTASRTRSNKRKLSDVLGSHWSREELERFYDAFRKYGKNWKKVAAAVHTKSISMVETLYDKNRAYLSLPEGAANVEGLVANMVDRYSNLAESARDHEANDALKKTRKALKCAPGEVRRDISKRSDGPYLEHLHNQSARSSNRHLSLKKEYPGVLSSHLPRIAVGKRTPRVPVTVDEDAGYDNNPPNNQSLKPDENASPGEDSYVAVLKLLGASQGSVPPLIRKELGRTELRPSSVQCVKQEHGDKGRANLICIRPGQGNHRFRYNGGKTKAHDGDFSEHISKLHPDVSSEIQQKIKRIRVKGRQLLGNKSFQCDDARELSTCEEEGLNVPAFVDRAHIEVSKENMEVASHNQGKKSPELLLEDESFSLDPLQMLVNVALQDSAFESVPNVLVRQQNGKDNSSHNLDCPGTSSVNPKSGNLKMLVQEEACHSSITARRSSFPSSAHHESENTKISHRRQRGKSSNLSSKLQVHVTLSANPESNNSKILAKEDRFSTVETDSISLKDAHWGKDVCPYANIISEVEKENRPSQEGELRNQDGSDNLYSTSERKQDGRLTEQRTGNSTNLSNPTEAACEKGGLITPNEILISLGSLANCQGILLSQRTKDKEAENEEAVSAQHPMYSHDYMPVDIQSREADIKAIAELSAALNIKEAVMNELKRINDNVSVSRDDGDLITDYVEQYQVVLRLLNEVQDPASSALINLRQRNTYNKKHASPCLNRMENSAGLGGPPVFPPGDILSSQNSSYVFEIVASSMQRARKVVDTAVLANSTRNVRKDFYVRSSGSLYSAELQQFGAEHSIQGTECPRPCLEHDTSEAISDISTPVTAVYAPSPGVSTSTDESSSLSDLVSACVAVVYMIQTTAESRYPPAEVAGVLEQAVKSLKPKCSQNLKIYGDLEKWMGVIKTQLLMLVPTPKTTLPTKIA